MSEAESQQQFFNLLVTILEWMPYVTLAVGAFFLCLILLFIWYRERLHKKGIMHRGYDGWQDGFTFIDLWRGKQPPDQHLWERDAERINRQSAKN